MELSHSKPMSEFKFACPVCGQHITADSSNSGGKIECPTCFQKIIIPQAPTLADPKFILSAAQADRPRPPTTVVSDLPESTKPVSGKAAALFGTAFVLLLCGLGVAGYVFRNKLFKTSASQTQTKTNAVAKKVAPPLKIYPVPTNFTLAL